MDKKNKNLVEKTSGLRKEIRLLRQQLEKARTSGELIKKGTIDAIVVPHKTGFKVFTEDAADKTYRILVEKMNEGAVTLSEDGIIIYNNACFSRMVGVSLQKITGQQFKDFIADGSVDRFHQILRDSRNKAVKEEIYLSVRNGKILQVLLSVNPLTLNDVPTLNLIITDLSIQKKSQEALKQQQFQLEEKNRELENANKDLTSFTYIASHDLQEPLRKIQNFAACILLEEDSRLSPTGKDYFHRMRKTAKNMQALIDDLLAYSRTGAGDRKFEQTDLGMLIEEIKIANEDTVGTKKPSINVGVMCTVDVIRFQFRQLMQNLISNSVKFAKPQKAASITISCEIIPGGTGRLRKLFGKSNYCHIIYTDRGIGFDLQYKELIFDVFQRLHSKEAYPGTGIGLAICKRIVENHHGMITATSQLNRGARFDIYIPANNAHLSKPSNSSIAPSLRCK